MSTSVLTFLVGIVTGAVLNSLFSLKMLRIVESCLNANSVRKQQRRNRSSRIGGK
jgi:hypothetical protein